MSKRSEEKPTVYSALEVANICGVVNQTAINWIRHNHLKAFNTPGGQFRVYPDDLAEFMKSRNMRVPQEVLVQCTSQMTETKAMKVLIVDDDEGFNNILLKYIEKRFDNAKVFQAFDGFDAGMKMVEKQPTCLILDLCLPGFDGTKLCSKISTSDAFGKPEIIVVTGLEDTDAEKKCKDLGVRYFFKKPLFIPDILKVLEDIYC